jgi:hypothetical protein
MLTTEEKLAEQKTSNREPGQPMAKLNFEFPKSQFIEFKSSTFLK